MSVPINPASSKPIHRSYSLPNIEVVPMFSLDEAIDFVRQNPMNCTEKFFLQNFNIVCSLPEVMATYDHPLNLSSLVRIVSNVCKWECGKQIFKEMVFELKDKKVELVLCNKPNTLGLNKKLFSLPTLPFDAIRDRKGNNIFLLQLNLSSDPLISHCRWCAVINIVTQKIEIEKLDLQELSPLPAEGCSAGHEFYHVCSFCRKIDTAAPEQSTQKHTQEVNLFSPICFQQGQTENTAMKLFGTGEEMRNLCGIKIKESKIIESFGEFDFWQQALRNCREYEGRLVLPLYCDTGSSVPILTNQGNAILRQLFQIKFPNYPYMPAINAGHILGPDFSKFSLIDVPGDGNCGISAVLVASGQMDENFPISNGRHLSLTSEQRSQMLELRERATECITLLHDHGIEISNRLISDGSWVGGEDFAFIAKAIQQPIVLIQASTKGISPYTMTRFTIKGNEEILTDQTPEQLLTEDSKTLFIYFNGVNHFQALKRNSSKTKCLLQ